MTNTALRDAGRIIFDRFTDVSDALESLKPSDEAESDEAEPDEKLALLLVDLLCEKERFQLWAANLGLFVVGDRSLDYRTRDNFAVKEYTGKLLNELEEDLLRICELLREDAVARKDRHQNEKRIELEVYHIGGTVSDMERTQDAANSEEEDLDDDDDLETQLTRSEETDEYINFEVVRAEFDDLVDIIDRLYRLAAKLRSTTARNPPSARNFYRDPYLDSDGNDLVLEREEGAELRKKAKEQTERFHYRRIKEIIRQALKEDAANSYLEEPDRVKFGPEENELVRNESGNRRLETKIKLNPHAKSVVRRIAIGTAYRQQQFIFWRQREWERRNIAARQKMQETKEGFMRQASKPLAGAEVLNEIGNQGLGVPADRKVPLSEIPSQTWKMPHEKNLLSLNETRSQTSKTEQTVTPTVYEPGGRKVGWPAFPKELNGKKDFICPYCFVTCPPKYRGKGHWRSHLIQDLQPYTCTAPICPEGDNKPLNTWEEWLVHEQVHHRMEYICSHHPTQSFLSREQYIDHIESVHSDRKDELLKSQEIDKHAQLTPKPTNGCPLCFYTADNWPDMDKHLGFHLETLSLLGLPLATGLEKDNEEMASLQLEGGGNNSELEILEDDATEDEYKEAELDQDGTHMPPGERITLNSLAKLQEQTLAARNGREAVAELLRDMSSAGINMDDGERDDESDIKSDKEPSYGSLLLAAEEGDETVVRLLLETSKADFDAQDRHGRTPLCLAAQGGHDVIVKLLLDTGSVIIDSRDYGGRTPLSWASANGHEGIVKQLLATGKVYEGAIDYNGWSPLLQTLEGHWFGVTSAAFSPDGKQLASASNDKTVKLWDAGSGALRQTLEGHSSWVNSVTFSPDGKQLASASLDKTVKLWDAGSGALRQTLEGRSNWVNSVAFSPDGKQLASASDDSTVQLWDTGSGALRQTLEGHLSWVKSVAFSPDGKQLASASNDKTVKLWDAGSGALRQTLEGHSNWVKSVTFSPDGKQLASASDDSTVKLWDTGSGALRQTLEGHSESVNSVAFSPDGKQLASASDDSTVKLWDTGSGALRQTLEGHSSWVNSVTFSPDGKQLASASLDTTVKLWDAGSGALIETPLWWAARNGHKGIVKLLLATGKVDVDWKGRSGWTPLSLAACNGHEGIVKLLLTTGKVDVDRKDSSGWTPLSWAAQNGHEGIVQLLLTTGKVDVNSKDINGLTPLSWAAHNGRSAVVKLLQGEM